MPSGIYKRIIGINYGSKGKHWKLSEKTKKKMRKSHNPKSNKNLPSQYRFQKGHKTWNKNKKYPQFSGKNHPNWKGENCKARQKRNDSLYQWWVRQVKKRDNNICQSKNKNCSGYNIVHHIKNWSEYPELRYETNNGITFCQKCHKEFHKIYGKYNNNQEQLNEFLK